MSTAAFGSTSRIAVSFRSLSRVLFSILGFLFFISSPGFAQSHARIVRLSYVEGDVQIDKGDGRGFDKAVLNMPVMNGAALSVTDGQAEVEFENGSSVRLAPDTTVSFPDLSLTADGQRSTSINVQQGTAYFHVLEDRSAIFYVQFGPERLTLKKSAHFRIDTSAQHSQIAVFKGEVEVANGVGREVAVKKNETIRLDSDDPDRYFLARGIDPENYDSWDNERAKEHDELASAQSHGFVYGQQDLSTYGKYYNVPGYGLMWRPTGVGYNWDPFADGYWVDCPGYGYTFVSGYPWGWAPYRYGSWQYVQGYGWGWQPTNNWNTWYAVPPLHGAPPHFRPPIVPKHDASVLVVNAGVARPYVSPRVVIDNDALQSGRFAGRTMRDGSNGLHTQGFVTGSTNVQGTAATQGFAASTGASGTAAVPPTPPMARTPMPAPRAFAPVTHIQRGEMPGPRSTSNMGTMHAGPSGPAPMTRTASPSFGGGGMHSSTGSFSGGGGHMGGGGGGGHSSGGRSR